MRLKVLRKWFTTQSTVGELHVQESDGEPFIFECYTLEDRIRAPGVKIKAQTAIAPGTYPLVIDFSERFQKMMPHVLYVPGFEGIRIHTGNTSADTEGCLLVGALRKEDQIFNSRVAFNRLFPQLEAACKAGKVRIEYVNENPPASLLA